MENGISHAVDYTQLLQNGFKVAPAILRRVRGGGNLLNVGAALVNFPGSKHNLGYFRGRSRVMDKRLPN